MRTCPACGRENADDFCPCGEYLRWEQTKQPPAVTPPSASSTASPGQSHADADLTAAPAAVRSQLHANGAKQSAPAEPSAPADTPHGAATLVLEPSGDGAAATGPVAVSVEPGESAKVTGSIRNVSEVVDNFDLSVRGLPEGWWTVTPATAYLVPYGTGGMYEQEIQIHLHPPRTPEAQARAWSFEVVAVSRAYGKEVAAAPATVTIGPYFEIATELRPERGTGRLKARYKLTVRNKANARTEVAVGAEDTDGACQFRFAEPSIAIEPGKAIECPFRVFPPKQIWIGRPLDRRFQVTATPIGVELPVPQPPRMAVFRQRPWLPWWMSIVVPIVAVLAVLAHSLLPKQTVVPNLKGAKTLFAAQKLLTVAGLKLQAREETLPNASPGVVNQDPAAGTKVRRGRTVTVVVAIGTNSVSVPRVIGLNAVQASTRLHDAGLILGTMLPQPDPSKRIQTQIPQQNTMWPTGTPVNVYFLAPPASATKPESSGGGSGGKPGGHPAAVPVVTGTAAAVAAQLVAEGFLPETELRPSFAPSGTVLATDPPPGASPGANRKVTLIVSGGDQLSYDDGSMIRLVDSTTGDPAYQALPPSPQAQSEASWSNDGRELVYVQGGRIWVWAPYQVGAQPFAVTAATGDARDPALALNASDMILAFIDRSTGLGRLCFGKIVGTQTLQPQCTSARGYDLGRQLSWAPNGKALLVSGFAPSGKFGLIEFRSPVAYSTNANDWGQGQLVTPVVNGPSPDQPQGVIAGAFSPDGKQLAEVTDIGGSYFFLALTDSADFQLAHPRLLRVAACEVSWRSDSKVLAVMQASGDCRVGVMGMSPTGSIGTVNISNRHAARWTPLPRATGVAHPAFQPVQVGG